MEQNQYLIWLIVLHIILHNGSTNNCETHFCSDFRTWLIIILQIIQSVCSVRCGMDKRYTEKLKIAEDILRENFEAKKENLKANIFVYLSSFHFQPKLKWSASLLIFCLDEDLKRFSIDQKVPHISKFIFCQFS